MAQQTGPPQVAEDLLGYTTFDHNIVSSGGMLLHSPPPALRGTDTSGNRETLSLGDVDVAHTHTHTHTHSHTHAHTDELVSPPSSVHELVSPLLTHQHTPTSTRIHQDCGPCPNLFASPALSVTARCDAVCCSVQRVAACCSVLQRVAACCSVLQRVAACCGVL